MGDRGQGPKSPVDRLVEAGLSAYGRGELDDALVAWESALSIDPDDTRALAYVDYVRQQYELVTGEKPGLGEEELGVPFGLGDDAGDYDLELSTPGGLSLDPRTVRVPQSPPTMLDPRDEGWGIEDDVTERARTMEAGEGITLEMEADEPPEPSEFEDHSTAEFPAAPRTKAPSSPGFLPTEHGEATTDEFAILEATTGIGQRALGFVQPTGKLPASKSKSRPELKVNIRTPAPRPGTESDDAAFDRAFSLTPPPAFEPADAEAPVRIPVGPPPGEVGEVIELMIGEDETPRQGVAPVASKVKTADFEKSEGPTRDLGVPKKPSAPAPAFAPSTARGAGPARRPADDTAPSIRNAQKSTAKLSPPRSGPPTPTPTPTPAPAPAPLAATTRIPAMPAVHDERDEPTVSRTRTAEGRSRLVIEVDRSSPPGETPEQRIRRRIGALIQLAQAAAKDMQLERAVLAIDAAFAQDPDSALAQKAIQSNKDAIFGVLHDYLGDLEKRPRLAKAMHDIADEPLDSRAAFLLSRVDGTLTYEELLDVSGMPRLEAGRYLCQLVMRGILAAD